APGAAQGRPRRAKRARVAGRSGNRCRRRVERDAHTGTSPRADPRARRAAAVQGPGVFGSVRYPKTGSRDVPSRPPSRRRRARACRACRRRSGPGRRGRVGRWNGGHSGRARRTGTGAGQAGRGHPRLERGTNGDRAARVDHRMKRRSAVDRRIYLIALGVIVLVFGLYLWAPVFLKTVETKLYDLHFTLRGVRHPGDQIVIVAVDENSLATLGRWPWPRSMLARMVRTLTEAGAKVIAIDILLSEPEANREREVVTRLSERLNAFGVGPGTPAGRALHAEEEHLGPAGSDRQPARAIAESGRVILPMVFDLKTGIPGSAREPSGPPLKSALTRFRRYNERAMYPPPEAERATAPIPGFMDAAQALGHVTMIADR